MTTVVAVVMATMVSVLVTVSVVKQHYDTKLITIKRSVAQQNAQQDTLGIVMPSDTGGGGSEAEDHDRVLLRLGKELDSKDNTITALRTQITAAGGGGGNGNDNGGDAAKIAALEEQLAKAITATQKAPADAGAGGAWDAGGDPLDGHKYTAQSTGFISKALTVEDAEMCDPKKQALLSPSWLWCPADPTCKQCSRHWDRNTEVVASFRHPDERQKRIELFKKEFADVSYNTVVVQAVNFGQVHLWLNWVCSCDQNGIEVRKFTVLVPADAAAERVIKEAGFHTVDRGWTKRLSAPIGTVYGGATNSIATGHSDINNALFLTGQELLDDGFNVLMLDVDFVWMRDPRPFLIEASRGRDVLAMLAPRWDAQGTANTGFVFMRNNFRTKILMHTIANLMPIKTHSDQLLFNLVLRHYKLRQISFAALPNTLFPILANNRKDWAKAGGWGTVITAHVVSSSKEARLYNTDGIFYNSTCKIYDAELWPCGPDPLNCWRNSKPPKYSAKED